MKYLRRIACSLTLAAGAGGLLFSSAFAANALDMTYYGSGGGGTIAGDLHVATLGANQPATGSGTMTLSGPGMTIYSGGFSVTSVKSINDYSGNPTGISSLPTTVYASNGYWIDYLGWLMLLPGTQVAAAPTSTSNFGIAVQLQGASCTTKFLGQCSYASVPADQDLFFYCPGAGAVMDVSIHLTGSMGQSAAQFLAARPQYGLFMMNNNNSFSTGSICQ